MDEFRCDVLSAEQLRELADAPLPFDLETTAPTRQLFRDLYLDTADDELRRRGVTCRLRLGLDDRRTLSLQITDVADGRNGRGRALQRFDAVVRAADPRAALGENTSPARRLRALVDPSVLQVRLELEVDRYVRIARRGWLRRPGPVSIPQAVSGLPSMANATGPVTRRLPLLSSKIGSSGVSGGATKRANGSGSTGSSRSPKLSGSMRSTKQVGSRVSM